MSPDGEQFICKIKNCNEPAFVTVDDIDGGMVCKKHYCQLRQINRKRTGVIKDGNDERVSG